MTNYKYLNTLLLFIAVTTVSSLQAQSWNWNEVLDHIASDGLTGDEFGHDVAIDGNRAIVSSWRSDNAGSESGSVYILELVNGTWTETTELRASDEDALDFFGASVDIYGNQVVIGAPSNDDDGNGSGSAYIYELVNGNWVETKITASDASVDDRFGGAVSIWGNRVVIGAHNEDDNGSNSGSIYVFDKTGGNWTETAKLITADGEPSDYFGISVALFSDRIISGAPNEGNSGSAYIFDYSNGSWAQSAKLIPAGVAVSSSFGASVSIADNNVIVGAPFDNPSGISIGGEPAESAGSAIIFNYNGSNWNQVESLEPIASESDVHFGKDVSIEGNFIAVGAPSYNNLADTGAVYMFVYSNNQWTETEKIVASNKKIGDCFGFSVDVSGNLVVAGAPKQDTQLANEGYAYIFESACPVDITTILGSTDLTITANNANASQYQWIDCSTNQEISGATSQSFLPTENGEYAVVVTEGMCTDTSACITINTVGLNDIQAVDAIKVYPNPSSNGYFTITTESPILDLKVIDIHGRAHDGQLVNNLLDLSHLQAGDYFIKLTTEATSQVKKVSILH